MNKDLLEKIKQVIKINTLQNILTISIEELADVYLLLEQIKIINNINDYEIERRINEKIRRTFEKVGVSN